MKYLLLQFSKIKELLRNKFVLLMLDYDGTLTPIVKAPSKAIIHKDTRELLQKLSRSPYCKIGIISGRKLEDIKNIVGIDSIIYTGNHGLEIQGPKIKFESQVSSRLKSIIRNIATDMQKRLLGIKGVLIENKGLTLSIHYRLVSKKDMPVFEKIVSEVTNSYMVSNKIKVNSGKKVYEIKPPVRWDKGKVVLWLLVRQQFILGEKNVLPIYIGDDITDEDAFKALKRKGLTVFVGRPGSSKADYYLKNTEEVTKFLRLILGLQYS
ncbi:MAG: trehalose-phosphatase [Candidatus Omnitrophica bacterium]|nr:trehalose-phosphatase [Candidatus Omnitrophota bacterium]MCG2707511.1 trehalose-phosphatase [Candidatus Omnitrophota bacterium]